MHDNQHRPRFLLGRIVLSPGLAISHCEKLAEVLELHQEGCWGFVPGEVSDANELAIRDCDDIISSHTVGSEQVWVMTDDFRHFTAVVSKFDVC